MQQVLKKEYTKLQRNFITSKRQQDVRGEGEEGIRNQRDESQDVKGDEGDGGGLDGRLLFREDATFFNHHRVNP